MLKKKEIARKVVRLLIRRIPKDKKTLISTGEFLEFLAQLYRKNKTVRNFFVSPFVPKTKKLEALEKIMERFSVPYEEIKEVFEYLIDINAFSLFGEIKRLYDHEVERIMKMSKGFLYLAAEIEKTEEEKIVRTLQKTLGKEIEITTEYDPSLIGGFVFKTSGFVLDTSVKRQLDRLLLRGG